MGYDGSLKFDTSIDSGGFNSGINKIGSIAKTALGTLTGLVIKDGLDAIVRASSEATVKIGMSFETQMSKVQAISGATGDEFDSLTEKAKEMGEKTKFSATESGQALEYMAMAGWKTEDMLNGIEGIMNLAAASGEELATTSDIVTDALTAFGMSASESGHFADVLAAASSNANTNVSMMGETFKYVAPVAGALGYSAEDTALAIGLMANSGIKAGQAGTALRAIMSRMTKPTDEVDAAMQKLGISLTDSHGNMKSLNEVMVDLRNGFSGLSEAESAQIASALGGQEAMTGLLAIVNTSDSDFKKLESSIYSCDGAAAQMAETMNNNLQGQLTILKSSAEALGLELYDSIKEPLTDIAKTGIEEINKLTQAFKDDGAGGLISAGTQIIADLITGIQAAAPKVTDQAGEIVSDLMTGIQKVAPRMLTSAVEVIASFAQGIGAQLPTLVPQALNMIVTLADAVISNIPTIVQAGISILVGLVSGIINSLPTLIQEGPRIINEFSNAIYNAIGTLLGTGLAMIAELGKGIINNLPLIIANAGAILKAIVNVMSLSSMIKLGKNLISSLGKGIKSVAPTIKSALKKIGEDGLAAIKNIKWSQVGKAIITFISTSLKSAGNLVSSALKSVGSSAMSAFKSINWASVGRAVITGIANGITRAVGTIVSAAKKAAKSALNAAKNFLGIHSPSTVFRDQVGKYMALGIGVGFEDNVPVDDINENLEKAVKSIDVDSLQIKLSTIVKSLQGEAIDSVSIPTTNSVESVSRKKALESSEWKGFLDEWERKQRKLNKERDSRPIFLGTERIDKPLPKGAVPAW
ncbi:MAG: phage tail tape measure protein [Lachnospiraceae bacterium]